MIIKGKAMVLGDNVSTDHIIAGKYCRLADVTELARHLFEGTKAQNRVGGGTILVAGKCFGCGSSREQAPLALKAAGVRAVLAESFGRIFYRNAINIGLPALILRKATVFASDGAELELDLERGEVRNNRGQTARTAPHPPFMVEILRAGGLVPYIRAKGASMEARSEKGGT